MKKKIALLLVGMMLLSGCAQKVDELSREFPDVGESVVESTADHPAEGQEASESEKGFPTVKIETLSAVRYAEDGETELAEIREDTVTLSGAGFEKGTEAVERLLGRTQDDVEKEADGMAADAADHYEFTKGEEYSYFTPYFSHSECEVTRLDARVLSVRQKGYDFTGGAHGYGGEWGTTIDLESGLKLELPHLMEDIAGFWTKAEELVLSELAERKDELFEDYQASVSQQLENTAWYLDGAGIEFCFSPYAIGPYSAGTIVVCVPYAEVAAYMKPEYLNTREEYVVQVPQNEKVQFARKDGETAEVGFENRTPSEYTNELFLILDGQECSLGENIWMYEAYLFRRADGRTFLVYDFDWASDDFETVVCEVTEGTVNDTDRIWASIGKSSVGLYRLGLAFSIQVFGSSSSNMDYQLTEDGKLEPTEERYEIIRWDESEGLLLTKDLPVEVDGAQTVVPAGSRIIVIATDNEGIAWFETVDGGMAGTIRYERREDDYQLYIDGVSEYEYFEDLPYAG
ncbi:MAG: DUF3298 and DUF4163 domain-containing protein [Acetatifactor sp.]|nr:DUF3298 and DUF4163 domain-containing protein [Acetatifactor sp.]